MPTINHQLRLAVLACSYFFAINVQAANSVTCTNENTAIVATTAHLTDNVDGTISDPETGLVWKKCSEGQSWNSAGNNCTGVAEGYNWLTALQRAQAVNGGTGENFSQSDWRVPNIKELETIVELRCNAPAINNTVFPGTNPGGFWSSSVHAFTSTSAWSISFDTGLVLANGKFGLNFVRLVRSGQ